MLSIVIKTSFLRPLLAIMFLPSIYGSLQGLRVGIPLHEPSSEIVAVTVTQFTHSQRSDQCQARIPGRFVYATVTKPPVPAMPPLTIHSRVQRKAGDVSLGHRTAYLSFSHLLLRSSSPDPTSFTPFQLALVELIHWSSIFSHICRVSI